MQNDKICSDIVTALVRTRLEANLLLDEVEALERSVYKIGEGDFNSTLESGIRAKTAYVLTQVLSEANRETILKSLKVKLNSLTYLGLIIAFEPNLEVIGRINTWVKQNLGEGVALDITINKTLLGGAVIDYKGKVGTFTLLAKVDQYFLTNHVNV